MTSQGFSVRSRLKSFRYALRGLWVLVHDEHNARIHAVATAAVLCLGAWVHLPPLEWAVIGLAVAGVWTTEALNAAIERLADATSSEPDPLLGAAKDLAAAGVLASAVGAALVGALVLGPRVLALL
jgi:diacylglycerol kinase (ATP)